VRQRIIKCRGGEVKLWYWVVEGRAGDNGVRVVKGRA
jgi:hypothetical protein